MATNEVFKYGNSVSLPVPDGTGSGDPVVVGQLTGVAQTDRDAAGNATVALIGAFNVSVGGNTAVAVGAPVYITSAGAVTAVATGNQLFGHALAAKGTATGVIPVRLTGFSPGAGA